MKVLHELRRLKISQLSQMRQLYCLRSYVWYLCDLVLNIICRHLCLKWWWQRHVYCNTLTSLFRTRMNEQETSVQSWRLHNYNNRKALMCRLHPVRSVTPADSGFRIKKARSHVLRTSLIEDVERGAELSFSGPLRGPCIIVKFCFQTTKFWFQTTDGRTDGRTDAINIFWAFLVKN